MSTERGMINAFKGGGSYWVTVRPNAVVHQVYKSPERDWKVGAATCDAQPGQYGYGWIETDKEITCPKCLKIIKQQEANNGNA